jgi:hypothetical protein
MFSFVCTPYIGAFLIHPKKEWSFIISLRNENFIIVIFCTCDMVSSYQFYNVNKQKRPWVIPLGTSHLNFTRLIKLQENIENT